MSNYLQSVLSSDSHSDEQSALILPIGEYGSIPQQSHKDPDETVVKHGTSLWPFWNELVAAVRGLTQLVVFILQPQRNPLATWAPLPSR
jgi:hypothetical protein